MNKQLPKVFANKIEVENINQNITKVNEEKIINLDEILDDKNKYLFNHKYQINLKSNQTIESSIISKKNNKVITIDGQLINIEDILSIKEIKK